jgi:uncharacterized SAM-binding protein YcdF (DUF218 family)
MSINNEEIKGLAKRIWDYHHLNHDLLKSDVILVLGSHDTRVAERAAELFLAGYAPVIIFSGGLGRLTKELWDKSEAEVFADIAIKMGVPAGNIIIENQSTNTGENILFTKKLLAERGIDFHSLILVQKPYMERRAYATFKKLWPEKDCIVTSPQISFDNYAKGEDCYNELINIMVGDLQRIKMYPDKGFQIEQDIPVDVWLAYEKLVLAGYNTHLIK